MRYGAQYLLADAEAADAVRAEVAPTVLNVDPDRRPVRAGETFVVIWRKQNGRTTEIAAACFAAADKVAKLATWSSKLRTKFSPDGKVTDPRARTVFATKPLVSIFPAGKASRC
ncbi:hypothetical protein ABIB82_007476 [Bradyrhizobium sp. i1.8.4]|uniref:hypothetical protein n=1 Tax=unclassified Bradyrhizobium TaxID=2631580 RepID=UPI003D1AEFDE